MNIAWITARQMLTMLVFMSCGFVLSKRKLISEEGSKAFATLLIYLIIPVVIFRSFLTVRSRERTAGLLISIGLAAVCLLLAILLSRLVFRKNPVAEFGSAFSNAGFLGIPLISATLGAEYVFYAAGFVALLNILQWSYGQNRMGVKCSSWKTVLLSSLVVSFLSGLVLYFLQPQIPEVLNGCVSSIATCNSPMAMILLGIYLGRTGLRQVFGSGTVWAVSGMRLAVIPLVTLLLLTWIPVDKGLKMALFLTAAAPVGANVSMYAQRANLDHREATGTVCLSTLLSLISLPLLTALASEIWQYR